MITISSVSSKRFSKALFISLPTWHLVSVQAFFLPKTFEFFTALKISAIEISQLETCNMVPPSFPFLLTTQLNLCSTDNSLRTITGLMLMLSAIHSELSHWSGNLAKSVKICMIVANRVLFIMGQRYKYFFNVTVFVTYFKMKRFD